jgi:hypothetical protein
MAGVKVTDLPVLGAAAADDVFYIVDTSSNTSSQIEVANLSGALGLESGTWTPTLSGPENACANPTLIKALYTRVGSIVTCTIYGTVDLDFTGLFSDGTIQTTFPIATTTPHAIGSVSINAGNQFNGYKNNTSRLVFQSLDTSFSQSDVEFFCVFQYEIN